MQELITIIVPCYNNESSIQNCISSIQKQSYNNIEIIIVNDGSIDKTSQILKELSMHDRRIKVFYNSNNGVSYSRNFGIMQANGNYVMFVDGDDYIESDMVKSMYNSMNEYQADLVVCKYLTSDDKVNNNGLKGEYFGKNEYLNEILIPTKGIAAFVWNRLYRLDIIKNNAIKFDENIYACEDTLFNYKYLQCIDRIVNCNKYLYHYVINDSSAMFSKRFNDKKLTGYFAFNYIINNVEEKNIINVKIAAAWYFEILLFQAKKYNYEFSVEEKIRIKEMLNVSSIKFLNACIPFKYKLFFPFIKLGRFV